LKDLPTTTKESPWKHYKICRAVWKNYGGIFDVDTRQKKIKELETASTTSDFWDNPDEAQNVLKTIKDQKKIVDPWNKAWTECSDLGELYEMAQSEEDDGALAELEQNITTLQKDVEHLEFLRKLSGEDDACNAVFSINSGAGGTESCDWTDMLFRMYTRWMENNDYSFTIIDMQHGEEAGLKSVTMEVSGEFTYGHLKAEIGVHRLVRISPFDSNARRHTSFASVYAVPIVEEIDDFDLNEEEIKVDTYRASGAGGQHVNKTDSAVRMTHIPTGIVVQCQNERSQMKNRASALRILKARVKQHYKDEEDKKRADKLAEKKKIEWGSQIRSYVLHPYNMVKDLRTGHETSNTQAVLDGEIGAFIEAFLLQFA